MSEYDTGNGGYNDGYNQDYNYDYNNQQQQPQQQDQMGFDQNQYDQNQNYQVPEYQNNMPHSSNPYAQPEQQQQPEAKNISDLMQNDFQKQKDFQSNLAEGSGAIDTTAIPDYQPCNDGHMVLHVQQPVLKKAALGDFHEYPIKGCDSNGDIECERRYSLFYELRIALVLKFPGLFVPPLPAKKMTGKKEDFTLMERQHFLNLFLTECSQLKYLAQSLELQTFLNEPNATLSEKLKKLQGKQHTGQRIAIYRACLKIREATEDKEVEQHLQEINEFINDQKILLQHLMTFKSSLRDIVPLKMAERDYYRQFSLFLEKYEETKMKKSNSIGELAHVKLISGPGNDHLKQKIEGLAQEFQNPFVHISHWVKGELYSLEALQEAYNEVMDVPNQKKQTIAQIKDTQDTVERLATGKFTFGAMLKSDTEKKESIINKEALIMSLKVDVDNYDTIRKLLIVYMSTVCIPEFQKLAKERYIIQMGLMCRSEVGNAASLGNCWHAFRQLITSYNIKEDD